KRLSQAWLEGRVLITSALVPQAHQLSATAGQLQLRASLVKAGPSPGGGVKDFEPSGAAESTNSVPLVVEVDYQDMGWNGRQVCLAGGAKAAEQQAFDS